jgi:hypothetical protein
MTQLRTGLRWSLGLLVAVGPLGMAGGIRAQDGAVPPEPRTFGTTSVITHTIGAYGFTPGTNATGYNTGGLNGAMLCTGAPCFFVAPVFLPAGALVTAIQLELCDVGSGPTENVAVTLSRVPTSDSNNVVELAATGTTGTPGCVFLTQSLAAPETIDNQSNNYFVAVFSAPTSAVQFSGVRLNYTLQVSPAPAVATFSDVPTSHPFFRFIEALVRSGITSGCGGGNFCPDAPLTRGQMAVFLSIGLGLHFAP